TRRWFEPRMGADLGAVRVHTGAAAARAADDLNAHAFAVGPHIAFADGQFEPGTASGRHLLAHELVHVLQGGHAIQRSAVPGEVGPTPGGESGELPSYIPPSSPPPRAAGGPPPRPESCPKPESVDCPTAAS